jgi:hypothetical protein
MFCAVYLVTVIGEAASKQWPPGSFLSQNSQIYTGGRPIGCQAVFSERLVKLADNSTRFRLFLTYFWQQRHV